MCVCAYLRHARVCENVCVRICGMRVCVKMCVCIFAARACVKMCVRAYLQHARVSERMCVCASARTHTCVKMCVCLHACTYLCTHVCMNACACVIASLSPTHARMSARVCTCMCAFLCVLACACWHVRVGMCVLACACAHACMPACTPAGTCVWRGKQARVWREKNRHMCVEEKAGTCVWRERQAAGPLVSGALCHTVGFGAQSMQAALISKRGPRAPGRQVAQAYAPWLPCFCPVWGGSLWCCCPVCGGVHCGAVALCVWGVTVVLLPCVWGHCGAVALCVGSLWCCCPVCGGSLWCCCPVCVGVTVVLPAWVESCIYFISKGAREGKCPDATTPKHVESGIASVVRAPALGHRRVVRDTLKGEPGARIVCPLAAASARGCRSCWTKSWTTAGSWSCPSTHSSKAAWAGQARRALVGAAALRTRGETAGGTRAGASEQKRCACVCIGV